ncbi:thiamine pyrophosphate-binding protein [Pseudomonas sp. W2Oct36]|jgi:acetolactate synthase-1/2/3 large subunit|uniref:thiamine pyrophosphate-binding protein n=1 Tax=unclassified Pseudomonas TaxID=196821 RepID=UPI0010E74CBF|nr:thiamine pyrophosphate-binding protein [Pseudomonas sp. CFBP 8772]MBD8596644.1 thiamine pyrophosphate-binding protein [Pseudomonas sp. CFBP 8772]RZA30837.1 MAG: thiamine pyrophosphate-binding protein [Pseudomonadota bacterium]
MKYFSDLLVDLLISQDIEYVCFNPGASFRGIHDSLVHHPDPAVPAILMCCHEEISVAMAHGYYKASGKHMVVLVHANIGLQHASMAIFNAWCDRVPLLVLGGNGPLDAALRRPWIDWIHTSQGIDKLLSGYTKWTDMPISQGATLESVQRALKLCAAEPYAPCYIAIDSAVQEETLADGFSLPAGPVRKERLPALDGQQLAELIDRLTAAQRPVIAIDYAGLTDDQAEQLLGIATAVGAAIITRNGRYNVPNTHPLVFQDHDAEVMHGCDFLLALEVQDLYGLLANSGVAPHPGLYIATLGTHSLLISSWVADSQKLISADLSLHANVAASITRIAQAVAESPGQTGAAERIQRITAHKQARGQALLAQVNQPADGLTIAQALVAIHEAIGHHPWVLTNTGSVTIDTLVRQLWPIERSAAYIGMSGGAGLGYGLGAAIGAALAHKGSGNLCVNLQSDGDLLYTPSALWTLSAYDIPLLVLVINNRLYLNSKQHAERIADLRQRPSDLSGLGTSFHDNEVDFVALAKTFDLYCPGSADTPEAIQEKIVECLAYMETHGKPALLEIKTL